MEIEIITTKKKLTKAIIMQMYRAGIEDMTEGEVLGHVKLDTSIAIIRGINGDYYRCYLNYRIGSGSSTRVYRRLRKGDTYIDFKSKEEQMAWWSAYQVMSEKAWQKHIYI